MPLDSRQVFRILSAAFLAPLLALPIANAKDKDSEKPSKKAATEKAFKATRKEFLQKSRSRRPSDRLAAIKLLESAPPTEAIDLIYNTLLADQTSEVRLAAIDFLKYLVDEPDLAEKIVLRMTTSTRKASFDLRAFGALQALCGTENEDIQFRVLACLNEFLGTPHIDQFELHQMIDDLVCVKSDQDSMHLLMLMTRTRLFVLQFGFRRCIIQGLIAIKDPEAITQLINLLPRLNGQVQFDVVSHLIATTGKNFGDDAGRWKVWWLENRGTLPKQEKNESNLSKTGQFGDYHGIPICAKRVVFVLDSSLSMRGAKFEVAKTELLRAIKHLPAEVHFSIIFFDGSVQIWQRELVPANEQMKHIAATVVLDHSVGPNTASYDALEAAFGLDPEAIYFLSDGAPQGGKNDNPDQIVSIFSTLNRVRRVSIHSVGVDTNLAGAAVFARFMKSLAGNNWGVYKAIN